MYEEYIGKTMVTQEMFDTFIDHFVYLVWLSEEERDKVSEGLGTVIAISSNKDDLIKYVVELRKSGELKLSTILECESTVKRVGWVRRVEN